MSWRNIIKRELYPLASRKELARSPMVAQQMRDALSQVQIDIDEKYDSCCENARARILEVVENVGHIVTSKGEKKSGKEAAEHVGKYDCDKLRRFLEVSLSKNRMFPEIKEEAKQILEDWKDCEGE